MEPSRAGPDVFVTSLGSRAGQIVLSRLRPDGTLQTLWERSNVTGLSHRRISPSGDSLTMQAELPGGGFQSMMIPGNGGEGRPILGKLETAGPFSPDGTQLVYYFGSPAADLGLLSLKDGSTRRLTNTPENEGSTQWTPDGKEIVVLRSAQRRRIAVVDLGGLLHRR